LEEFTLFDIPGINGGDKPFYKWVEEFMKKIGNQDIALALLVMSKDDRFDAIAMGNAGLIKDFFKEIKAK
jgi:hypothetical protein